MFPHGRRDLVGACPIATLPPYPFETGLDDRVLHDDPHVADVLADSLAHESHRVRGLTRTASFMVAEAPPVTTTPLDDVVRGGMTAPWAGRPGNRGAGGMARAC